MKPFLFVLLFALAPEAHALRVMIDPGHGGVDTGAVRGSLREADLVLKVATKLRDLLAKETDSSVVLTREDDRAVSLPDRMKKADEAAADLFVSLHANATPDGKARGVELFFQNSLPADEDALFLANLENQSLKTEDDSIAEVSRKGDVAAIVADLHRQSRILSSLRFSQTLAETVKPAAGAHVTIKQAPLFVVSKAKMPSVLVEIGFITHSGEAKRLASDEYQNELAAELKNAILRYRAQMIDPAPRVPSAN